MIREIREKCLCCECKYYHNPVGICEGYDKFPQRIGCTTVGSYPSCDKGEVPIKDRIAKEYCKYFEESE